MEENQLLPPRHAVLETQLLREKGDPTVSDDLMSLNPCSVDSTGVQVDNEVKVWKPMPRAECCLRNTGASAGLCVR